MRLLLLGLCVFVFYPHAIILPNSLIKYIWLQLTIPWFIYDQLRPNWSFYIKTKHKKNYNAKLYYALCNTIFFFQWLKIYSICIYNIAVPTLHFALFFFLSLSLFLALFSLYLFLFVCLSFLFFNNWFLVFYFTFFLFFLFLFLFFFFLWQFVCIFFALVCLLFFFCPFLTFAIVFFFCFVF